jgi:hypothetical protein
MNRNDPCACGSGKRYKHCHGRLEPTGPSTLHLQAVAAHRAGALRRAEALYRQALDADPRDVDSLHMLGMVHFERRRYREALEVMWDAAERNGWNDEVLRQNLGLLLAKLLAPEANARQESLVGDYLARMREIARAPAVPGPVSVVLIVGSHASTRDRAIASVSAQTYADIDLVVVEDATWQAVDRAARGARGRHVAFLDAGDWFAPERIEALVLAIARATPLWGFSRVRHAEDGDVASTAAAPRDFLAHEPPSFTLLARNVIERGANLFVDRNLFAEVGGFRDGIPDPAWDFCVRAAKRVEPIVVAQPLYVHGGRAPPRGPAIDPFSGAGDARGPALLADALQGDAAATNPFCPHFPANRILLLRSELRAGRGDRLPVALLREIAAGFRARPAQASAQRAHGPIPSGDRVALVVLGMYRSGTSAFARALNLCGAVLPERMIAARLGINPKGFWESEAVTDLDVRMLEHLGGDWNRVGFTLPDEGALVDEFLLNAREVIETEYGNAPFILIKDPRVCVLAPLWHRALQQAGYRPAYLVVVRHPLEVAGSLQTQGDMPLATGLALWLDYMQRVERFAQAVPNVAHVRYSDLLEDWRDVMRRIARRLDVPLDAGSRAQEVDRFLEAGLRTHHADDAGLEADSGAQAAAIRALHRRLLGRCDADRTQPQGLGGT